MRRNKRTSHRSGTGLGNLIRRRRRKAGRTTRRRKRVRRREGMLALLAFALAWLGVCCLDGVCRGWLNEEGGQEADEARSVARGRFDGLCCCL